MVVPELAREVLAKGTHIGGCPLERDALLETRVGGHEMVATRGRIELPLKGNEQLRAAMREAGGHDADHFMSLAVEDYIPSDEAGIGDDVDFATKPKLARRMLERLLAAHGPQAVPWFTADEAYGDNPGLRAWLDEQDINYVMAVSCDARFTTPTGPRRADELAA